MSTLLWIAAAHAAQQHRRSLRKSAIRRMQDNNRHGGSSYGSSGSYYESNTPTYIDSVMHEIGQDDELKVFFDTLMKNAQMYRMEQEPGLIEEGKQILSLIEKYEAGLGMLDLKLRELGIRAHSDREGRSISYCENGFDLTVSANEIRRSYIPFNHLFNGLELTPEIIDNPPYRERYEAQKEKCEEIRVKKAEAEKRLKRDKFLNKIIFFQTETRYERMRYLRSEIYRCEQELEKEAKYKSELETFESFTPEQLKAIRDYLEAVAATKEAAKLLNDKNEEYLKTVPAITEKEVAENAFDRTVSELGMGEEQIEDLYRRMDRVAIRRFRGEYDGISEWSERTYYWQQGRGNKKELVSSFIKNIYEEDPEFVDRNMEQVLEDEKERDE